MKFQSISLTNFMPFYGEHNISFPESGAGNVVLIYGDNMRGKTSLLNAIRWALYGTTLDRYRKSIPLINILNKDAYDARDFRATVAIRFIQNRIEYEIRRSFQKKPLIDTPRSDDHFDLIPPEMKKSGVPIAGHLIEHEINQILPESISRFSLFDGELLQEYEQLVSDATQESTQIKDAIERILGVPALLNARAHLQDIRKRTEKEFERVESSSSNYKDLISKKSAERDLSERELESLDKSLEEARGEVEKLDAELKRFSQASAIKNEVDLVDRTLADHRTALSDRQNKLKDISSKAWLASLAQVIAARRDDLANTIVKEQQNLVGAVKNLLFAESLKNGTCSVCGSSIGDPNHSHPAPEITNFNPDDHPVTTLSRQLSVISNDFRLFRDLSANTIGNEILLLERDIDRIRFEIHRYEAKKTDLIKDAPDIDFAEFGRKQNLRENWNRDLSKREAARAIEKKRFDALEREFHHLMKLAAASPGNKASFLSKKVSLVAEACEIFDKGVDSMRSRLREVVQAEATKTFKALSTEAEYTGLTINNRYGLEIKDHRQRPVKLRSAGAEQIVALSLIDGLKVASGKRAPLVMDTPFGRLDPRHRANVLRALPKMAEQVILLVHEGELNREDLPHIAPAIAAEMQIIRKSPTQSEIIHRA